MNPERDSCPDTGKTLLFLAGELDDADVPDARVHLENCQVCASLTDDLSEVEKAYSEMPLTRLAETEKRTMLATATRSRHAGSRFVDGFQRPLLAAAAAAVLFVAGLATGTLLTRPGPPQRPALVASADSTVEIESRDVVERARFVAELGPSPMRGSTVSELVSLLRVEPNPNVRLAITDALRGADMNRADQMQLLQLLSSEPIASLRIEILELAVDQGVPGLGSTLRRVSRADEAATVREFATRTLASLEGQP